MQYACGATAADLKTRPTRVERRRDTEEQTGQNRHAYRERKYAPVEHGVQDALLHETPPIVVSLRTIERDIAAIKHDVRRYLTAQHFDARVEIGMALARHELIARTATKYAGDHSRADAARWARVAIRATEAKTQLLQDINLIDRTIGTLFVDDSARADRIPSGAELRELYESIVVTDAEITSEAELAWLYGDQEAGGADE